MKALFRYSNRAFLSVISVFILCMTAPVVRADWGGTITGSAATSQTDTVRSDAVDQQYTAYTSSQPTENVRYSFAGLFRHLQSRTNKGPYSWSTELSPSGAITWSTPVLDIRGDGSYRADRDELGTTKLTTSATTVRGQTNWTSLPRLFASSNWSKNVNDLELIGYDTRTRTFSAGGNLSKRNLYLNYEFTDVHTRNAETNLDRKSRGHSGRADYTKSLARQLVSVSTSYQIATRTEKDYSPLTGEPLIAIPAATGLYLADPSPEFDALDGSPALVDGLVDVPAGQDFNLVNGVTHNFGLDFGQAVAIDHLHLYVDTLAALPLTWSIWQSSDNLNWTPVASSISAPFSSLFLRYEFAFTSIQTRYIKLTVSPQLLNTPVEVTELRGLVIRTDTNQDDRTTDQRGSARVQFQPSKWVSWEVAGDAVRQSASLTTLSREEDGVQTSFHFNPARVFDLAARYQWSRSNYTDSDQEFAHSSTIGSVVRSQWSKSVSTSASVDRGEEESGNFLTRRGDRARAELRTLLLPALRTTSQFIYSEDERFDSPDKLYTRSLSNDFEGEPTERSQISVTYRYETRSARVSAVRKYQTSVGGRLSYRLTDTIHLIGNAVSTTDPVRRDRSYDGIASWTPTYKISLSAAVNRIEGSQTENANQYSIQAVYNWSLRTELSASYSLNERETEGSTSSGRMSLFTRF